MTDFVYDRTFYTQMTSTAVDEVFYDSKSKRLVVALLDRNGGDNVLAGYENVPLESFTAFMITNQNKIDGNDDASVGAYYNYWIKPYYKGFDTTDLYLIDAAEEAKNAPVVEDNTSAETVEVQGFVNAPGDLVGGVELEGFLEHLTTLEQPEAFGDFTVIFNEGDELTISALNVNDALVRFHQIAEIAGWDQVVITAVTQHFA